MVTILAKFSNFSFYSIWPARDLTLTEVHLALRQKFPPSLVKLQQVFLNSLLDFNNF